MIVTIINHSDSRGGASVVSLRLAQALRSLGVDARMLVVHKASDKPYVARAASPARAKIPFLEECLDIYLHNGLSRDNLFKVSTACAGLPLHSHPWVKEADAVMLNWVNQGMLSLKEIARIKAPVVWTMHDMWCLTGICHHAGQCERYKSQCGECPLLGCMAMRGDISHRVWRQKSALYGKKDIYFVAVSNWLAQKCRESSLMAESPLSVIPNAFPVDAYSLQASKPRSAYGLPEGKKLIAIGAARLDDPIKRLDLAIDALNLLSDDGQAAAVLFGNIRDPRMLDALKMPYVHLGPIGQDAVRDIYAHASVALSSSSYETLPGTLVEGMAAGCVPVAFNQGGQADIIDHLSTGYIARFPDAADLAAGLRWALSAGIDPAFLHQQVAARFGAEAIAKRYIALLSRITDSTDS